MTDATTDQSDTPPRTGRIRWWDLVVVAFGGTLAGVLLTALLGVAALLVAMHFGYRPRNAAGTVQALQTNLPANMAVLVTSDLGLLVVAWFVVRRRFGAVLAHYFPRAGAWPIAGAVLSGVVLSVLLNGGNELLSRASLVRFDDSAVERALVPHNAAQFAAAIAVVALFAPFVEELLFRGLLFEWLRAKGGTWLAVGASALIFAVLHGQMLIHPGVQGWLFSTELLLAGVVLALWVVRSGSLRASFATHAAYNATAVILSVLLP